MKIKAILILPALLVLATFSAQAEFQPLGRTKSGYWYFDPTPRQGTGDCRSLVYRLRYHVPQSKSYGQVALKQVLIKICCTARAYHVLGGTYFDPAGKLIKNLKYPQHLAQKRLAIKPRSVVDSMWRKVCPWRGGGQLPGPKN